MSIEKRTTTKGNTFRVKIHNNCELDECATFKSRQDAEEWERKKKQELCDDQHFPERPKNLTFAKVCEEWLEVHSARNKSPNSQVKDRQVYRDYLGPSLGKFLLKDLKPQHFDSLIAKLQRETELSKNSINKILEISRSVLNFSVARRYIPYSPMTSIKMLRVDKKPFHYWTREEASTFLSHANEKYCGADRWKFALYLMLLTTGMRIREATGLRWENIHFDAGIIMVATSFDRVLKVIKDKTKGHCNHPVPLTAELKQELLALRNKATSRTVFVGQGSDDTIDADSFRKRVFSKDIEAANVRQICVHDLRHTFASNFMMSGGSLYDLQTILGHSDVKTTMMYAHLSPKHIADKANVVKYDTDLCKDREKVVSIGAKQTFGFLDSKLTAQKLPTSISLC